MRAKAILYAADRATNQEIADRLGREAVNRVIRQVNYKN